MELSTDIAHFPFILIRPVGNSGKYNRRNRHNYWAYLTAVLINFEIKEKLANIEWFSSSIFTYYI